MNNGHCAVTQTCYWALMPHPSATHSATSNTSKTCMHSVPHAHCPCYLLIKLSMSWMVAMGTMHPANKSAVNFARTDDSFQKFCIVGGGGGSPRNVTIRKGMRAKQERGYSTTATQPTKPYYIRVVD